MTTPLAPARYAATGGTCCPYCRSTDLTHGPLRLEKAIAVTQPIACLTCQARWQAVFELMGYEPAEEEESVC